MEPSITLDIKQPCISSADWNTAGVDSEGSQLHHSTTVGSKRTVPLSNTSHIVDSVPHSRLRPRKPKEAKPRMTIIQPQRHQTSPLENSEDVNECGSQRPIIFAVSQRQSRPKKAKAKSIVNYTLDNLVEASCMDDKHLPESVRPPHMHLHSESFIPYRFTCFLIQIEFLSLRATWSLITMHY
jgi:hypothetical protein